MNFEALNLDALRPLIPLPMLTKLFILLGVVVGICIAYYAVVWSPLQDEIVGEKAQLESQRVLLSKNQRLASNIPKKQEEYKNLQVQLKVALNMLPKKSQIPDLLEGVSWAGKDSGLSFSAFKPGKEVLQSIYAEVPVSLNVSGTFRQLLTFLKRVGEMPRIVDVKNLSLSTSVGSNILTIQGQAVTYRFVEGGSKKKVKKK